MQELDLGFIDSFCVGLEPAQEANFRDHPCGTFNGYVQDVKIRHHEGKKIFEIFVETRQGVASHSMWSISKEDETMARSNEVSRKRLISSIQRHKRLMVTLGVMTEDESKLAGWLSLESAYGQLQGKNCQISVKPDTRKPGKTVTFINRFRKEAEDVIDKTQVVKSPKPQSGGFNSVPPNAGLSQPGFNPTDDGIPF